MKTFLTALAVALVAIFVVAGCNDQGNTFQNNTGAQITTLSPSNITAGSPSFTLRAEADHHGRNRCERRCAAGASSGSGVASGPAG